MDWALVSKGEREGEARLLCIWSPGDMSGLSRLSIAWRLVVRPTRPHWVQAICSSILHLHVYMHYVCPMRLNLGGACMSAMSATSAVVVLCCKHCILLLPAAGAAAAGVGVLFVEHGTQAMGGSECRQALMTLSPHRPRSAVFRPPYYAVMKSTAAKGAVLNAGGCSKPADCSSCRCAQAACAYCVCTLVFLIVRLSRQSLVMRGGQPLWCGLVSVLCVWPLLECIASAAVVLPRLCVALYIRGTGRVLVLCCALHPLTLGCNTSCVCP